MGKRKQNQNNVSSSHLQRHQSKSHALLQKREMESILREVLEVHDEDDLILQEMKRAEEALDEDDELMRALDEESTAKKPAMEKKGGVNTMPAAPKASSVAPRTDVSISRSRSQTQQPPKAVSAASPSQSSSRTNAGQKPTVASRSSVQAQQSTKTGANTITIPRNKVQASFPGHTTSVSSRSSTPSSTPTSTPSSPKQKKPVFRPNVTAARSRSPRTPQPENERMQPTPPTAAVTNRMPESPSRYLNPRDDPYFRSNYHDDSRRFSHYSHHAHNPSYHPHHHYQRNNYDRSWSPMSPPAQSHHSRHPSPFSPPQRHHSQNRSYHPRHSTTTTTTSSAYPLPSRSPSPSRPSSSTTTPSSPISNRKIVTKRFTILDDLSPEKDAASDMHNTSHLLSRNESTHNNSSSPSKPDTPNPQHIRKTPQSPRNTPQSIPADPQTTNVSSHPIHKHLFAHQLEAVRFLHANLSQDFGCLLCDIMGLGKTISCLSYISQFCVSHPHSKDRQRILILMPSSVIGHWESEIDKVNDWLRESHCSRIKYLSLNNVTSANREKIVQDWYDNNKVLLMTYPLFRSMLITNRHDAVAKMLAACDTIFLDEGHRIKNAEAQISRALEFVETTKRVVCTGYPVQNNLVEYFSLINFVRPGALGDFEVFQTLYIDPIEKGLNGKSAAPVQVKREARGRAWVLHEMLKPFVLRRDSSILKATLPPKHEIFILVHPTEVQRTLLNRFVQKLKEKEVCKHFFWFYNVVSLCMNHPDTLMSYLARRERRLSELSKEVKSSKNRQHVQKLLKDFDDEGDRADGRRYDDDEDEEVSSEYDSFTVLVHAFEAEKRKVELLKEVLEEYTTGDLFASTKFVVLFRLIFQCKFIGEKIVVFSRSISTLNFIEDCINEHNFASDNNKIAYVRLDGTLPPHKRHSIVTKFNKEKVDVALISTLAGGEGINLTSANRIIIMDVNFNPSHDVEACCRVYRYGQKREVFVYRLIGNCTPEHRVINAQLRKERLADWIVDDRDTDTMHTFDKKYYEGVPEDYKETPVDIPSDFDVTFDPMLQNIVEKYKYQIHSLRFHDTLLFSNEMLEMDSEDKDKARIRAERDHHKPSQQSKSTAKNKETEADRVVEENADAELDNMDDIDMDWKDDTVPPQSTSSSPPHSPAREQAHSTTLHVDTTRINHSERQSTASTYSFITPTETPTTGTPSDDPGPHILVEQERQAMHNRLLKNAQRASSKKRKRSDAPTWRHNVQENSDKRKRMRREEN